jgi:hypothetical protein
MIVFNFYYFMNPIAIHCITLLTTIPEIHKVPTNMGISISSNLHIRYQLTVLHTSTGVWLTIFSVMSILTSSMMKQIYGHCVFVGRSANLQTGTSLTTGAELESMSYP